MQHPQCGLTALAARASPLEDCKTGKYPPDQLVICVYFVEAACRSRESANSGVQILASTANRVTALAVSQSRSCAAAKTAGNMLTYPDVHRVVALHERRGAWLEVGRHSPAVSAIPAATVNAAAAIAAAAVSAAGKAQAAHLGHWNIDSATRCRII